MKSPRANLTLTCHFRFTLELRSHGGLLGIAVRFARISALFVAATLPVRRS